MVLCVGLIKGLSKANPFQSPGKRNGMGDMDA
jgi:hypothetical protein